MSNETANMDQLRERAIRNLKKRRDFKAHLLVYVLMNAFVVAIWAVTGAGFFWPVFLLVGWGIGLVMNAWDVYFNDDFDEEQIKREIEHLESHR